MKTHTDPEEGKKPHRGSWETKGLMIDLIDYGAAKERAHRGENRRRKR